MGRRIGKERLVADIPTSLKTHFRKKCGKRDMTHVIIELLEKFIGYDIDNLNRKRTSNDNRL